MRAAALLGLQALLVTAANVALKLAAAAEEPSGFWALQAAGNLLGLGGVLAYTRLLRTLPLHRAVPLAQAASGLGVLGLGSALYFQEPLGARQLAGAAVALAGVAVLGAAGGPRRTEG